MPLSFNVSLSRKGHHVSNATFSINLTAELDPSLLTRPKELQERIAGLYAQAAQALDRQAGAPVLSSQGRCLRGRCIRVTGRTCRIGPGRGCADCRRLGVL
jgi:hypothetical protein